MGQDMVVLSEKQLDERVDFNCGNDVYWQRRQNWTRLTMKIPPKLIKASATSPINSIVEGHVDLGITSVFSG